MGTVTIVFWNIWCNINTAPRLARVDVGGEVYHVINRANGRMQIFDTESDYRLFEKLLWDAKEVSS